MTYTSLTASAGPVRDESESEMGEIITFSNALDRKQRSGLPYSGVFAKGKSPFTIKNKNM